MVAETSIIGGGLAGELNIIDGEMGGAEAHWPDIYARWSTNHPSGNFHLAFKTPDCTSHSVAEPPATRSAGPCVGGTRTWTIASRVCA